MPHLRTDDHLRLHYADEGNGPALVLVHGWMMSGRVFEPQVAHFSERRRVIVPDLRGCGGSEARGGTYTMARYAADLDQLLAFLDVRDAALVGWSMGGGITMEYLARYGSGRVRAVGLVDFPPRLEEDPSVADKVCHSLNSRRESFLDGFLRRMVLDPTRPHVIARLRAQVDQCKSETACEMYRAMRPTGPTSTSPIAIPAFLAFPENGWFRPALDEWKARFPTHAAPVFPRSKHCPFLEEPEAFNEGLDAFLRSHKG